jgi:hypothetical protein
MFGQCFQNEVLISLERERERAEVEAKIGPTSLTMEIIIQSRL